MYGLGTLVNAVAIVIGGLLGVVIGKWMKPRFQEILTVAMGLSVMFLSIGDVIANMLVIENGSIQTQGTFMMIFSLALGGLLGELINLDEKFETFGEWLKQKTGNARDADFVNGFVTASLTVCIGAMAIMGSIMDGIYGNHTILFTKAILDLVIVVAMASSLGKGCIFSAIPVLILQGSVTALSRILEPIMTERALSNLSLVGSILIFCVGLNLIMGGKYRIRVANLLPSIVFAVAAAFIPFLQ